jgi:predicted NAD-dependent protein-ADP-ribosyltransferase YbiA (DUF1768 family)
MVSNMQREIRLIRETFHEKEDISDADILKHHQCPFIEVEEYIKQKAAGATVDIKKLSPEQIGEYFPPVWPLREHSNISPSGQKHLIFSKNNHVTNTLTEFKIKRVRLLNKHGAYMNLLHHDVIKQAMESLYLPTDAAKMAMPSTSTKAAAINYVIGRAKSHHKNDGSWYELDKLEALLKGDICVLPEAFRGIRKQDSFLAPTQIDKAKKNLKHRYDAIFPQDPEEFNCYNGHFVTFYSARGESIIAAGSQMVQFKITVDDFEYQSNEKYYQIQKVIRLNALSQDPKFANTRLVKLAERPKKVSKPDWREISNDTICKDLINLILTPSVSGKRARAINECWTVEFDNMDQALLDEYEARHNVIIAEILLEVNWAKFSYGTYKALLLMTGTLIILENCPGSCDCRCGIACNTTDFARTKKKAQWRENLLGKTLMAIRHAFFEEERTGVLTKPTLEDVLNAWDWRQPIRPKNCRLCHLTGKRGVLPYPGCYPDDSSGFYEQEATI